MHPTLIIALFSALFVATHIGMGKPFAAEMLQNVHRFVPRGAQRSAREA